MKALATLAACQALAAAAFAAILVHMAPVQCVGAVMIVLKLWSLCHAV